MKHLENERLVRLVADSELQEFARRLHTPRVADRTLLSKIVREMEPRTVVDAVLGSMGETVVMLSEIFRFVAEHGASLRTTAFVLVLPGADAPVRHVFSKQLVGMVLRFADDWSTVGRDDAFARIGKLVDETLVPWIKKLENDGRPRTKWRPSRRMAGMQERRKYASSSCVTAGDAYEPLLRAAYERVIAAIGTGAVPPAISTISECLRRLNVAQKSWRAVGVSNQNTSGEVWANLMTYARLRLRDGKLIILVEQLMRLGDTLTQSTREEFLQLALLRDRPRIFEVWVMIAILIGHEKRGAKVALEGIEAEEGRWELNFARATEPCATVTLHGRIFALHYQKYVPGAMPDILLAESTNARRTVWVVDPKYSEKGSYSWSSYVSTAMRYAKSFSPDHSIVAEFFPRTEINAPNPWQVGAAAIIRNVRPGSKELGWLVSKLLASLPPVDILAVDVSTSCLDAMRQRARARTPAGDRLLLTFATAVGRVEGALLGALESMRAADRSQLRPLVEYLERLHVSGIALGAVEIWSDWNFEDEDVQSLVARVAAICISVVR